MNYIHHAMIGVGTAALAVIAAEALGAPTVPPLTLGVGALAAATGAIATDLDHPRSFISHSIPSRMLRITLAILAIPTLAAVGVLLSTHDLLQTWNQFSGLLLGWDILRWTLIILVSALGLVGLSWVLYKSLHHRGPLHSLLFALGVTVAVCLVFSAFHHPWYWGLAFGWGWLWHILGDGLTVEGVPFFWPINDERSHTLPWWMCGVARWLLSALSIGGILGLIILRITHFPG